MPPHGDGVSPRIDGHARVVVVAGLPPDRLCPLPTYAGHVSVRNDMRGLVDAVPLSPNRNSIARRIEGDVHDVTRTRPNRLPRAPAPCGKGRNLLVRSHLVGWRQAIVETRDRGRRVVSADVPYRGIHPDLVADAVWRRWRQPNIAGKNRQIRCSGEDINGLT